MKSFHMTKKARFEDEEGYLVCEKHDWDGNCPDDCAEHHTMYCALCNKPLETSMGLVCSSQTSFESDMKPEGIIEYQDDLFCPMCALSVGDLNTMSQLVDKYFMQPNE